MDYGSVRITATTTKEGKEECACVCVCLCALGVRGEAFKCRWYHVSVGALQCGAVQDEQQ